MTIKQKLLGCLAIFAIATLSLLGASYWSATNSSAALRTVLADRVVPLRDLKIVADSYAVDIVDSAHKARNGNLSLAEGARHVREGASTAKAAWLRYRGTEIQGKEEQLASAAETRMQASDASVDRLLQILQSGDRAALERFVVGEMYQSIDPLSETVSELVALQIEVASAETTAALSTARTAMIMMLALALASAAVLGFSYLTITKKVISPIQDLARVIKELARSSGEATLPNLDQKDEIGDITRSVDAFLSAAVNKERDRAALEAAEQQMVTGALRDSLAALTAGDLTSSIKADFPPAYVELKTNFNAALASLRDLIGSVIESSRGLRGGSGEIAQASEDLARRTESNAASLEEASAALTQIDGRIKATADAATRTVTRADQTISTVSGGRTVAEEAVQAMSRVRESAKGIDEVIEGVDKIAFQTRVLAMNAAVEAGRAGDAGRGFAVVADLVSALAMRAEEEAKRAREQLTLTQTDIVTAVAAVQKVDGALANISEGVGEVHQLLDGMASDNLAQASAISQISVAVTNMDQATQQNAAMVEETSAAARNLNSESEALADKAGQFRISDADQTGEVRISGRARESGIKSVPAGRSAKHFGGAFARPALAAADGAWESF
ncbi:methyl-accepting chemotaxis protein [Sphingomonas mucosissima]|uniref:Methyl-accepting chemotaxis protein II n=1 Tax=Sphingomonas mucosissima TaxID=370959 RepID=A0A245ZR75_9SPHN|nr:methyl-accepting chemotaxis protein [Sphingomonas mucosissima]OWK32248.1 methyl-accepting chemotaxis protein II [Sphingomonas mucosissima]